MRILIHGINFHPELTGIGKYTGEMAEWLAKQGHAVRVVTAPPYYPQWHVADGHANRWRREECLSGLPASATQHTTSAAVTAPGKLEIIRCPLWVPAKPSGLKRLVHLASFALSSFPIMIWQIFWHPDVVLVIEPALFCAPQAWLAARLSGASAWLHIQDFEVDAAFDMGLLRSTFLRWVALGVERMLMQHFDRVSTISHNMLKLLESKKVRPERCCLFPNWVDTDFIYPLPMRGTLPSECGIAADAFVALYSGNMGEKQGLEVVLEAARKLAGNPRIQFVMCGDGAARQRMMNEYGTLHNVIWLPLQPLERLNELLNMADVHLLPQRADVSDLVMPSRLTGMLASGRPVISTAIDGSQVAEVVQQCGIVTPPDDANAFAEAVLRLAHDETERNNLGKQARTYALAHLGKQSIMERFEHMLNTL